MKWVFVLLAVPLLCLIVLTCYPFDTTNRARVVTTEYTLKELHFAVNTFRSDTGRYPTEKEGIKALVEKPDQADGWTGYLETTEVPRDAWKNPFIYKLNPDPNTPFVIISYGQNGREGGTGYDADLYSTDVE